MGAATGNAAQAAELERRIAAAQLEVAASAQRLAETRSRLAETRSLVHTKRTEREAVHEIIYARLLARMEGMPAVEQAKGIIMAQSGCGADDALAMLRAASRRCNVRVDVLAAQIVSKVAAGKPLR